MGKISFKRLTKLLPVLILVLALLAPAATATDETFDTENFKGLVLTTTASDVTVTLYNGRADDAAKMTPVYTEGTTYYYEVTAGNTYHYVAKPTSGSGRYNIRKNIYISAEEANTKIVLDVTPAKRSTSGWDTWAQILSYSDEAMAAAYPSSPDLWPDYDWAFTTPVFTNPRTPNKQTTQNEMMDYMGQLDGADDNMYVFNLGKSGGSKASEIFDIPVVFYSTTDLSGATTWEEAAALVKGNGKLTVMYQALIHGLEPGGGEAALAMLKAFDGAYGEDLLENMNICVIPRLNPYGVYMTLRQVYANGTRIDPNRDFLKLESNEVQLRTKLYNAIAPEVCLDSHECNLHPEEEQVSLRDVWVSTNFTPKATDEYRDMAMTITYKIFDRAKENNLSYGWYSSSINGYSGNISSTNVSMRGSLVFLNESMGIAGGMQQMERRIMSHVTYVTAVLDYVNANTASVQKVVDDQRADIVSRGKTYEESDIIVLESDATYYPEHSINGKQVDTGSGVITDTVLKGKIYDVVKQSRVAPTAYVIPAGEDWTADVLAKLDIHGIAYTQLPANTAVQLQQYTGTVTKTALTAEKTVVFPNGAYVMTMAQENGYILALLMEPDVPDVADKTGTFAQQGLITATDGSFPIYRYIRNLNADGTIDYAAFDKETFHGVVLTTTASDVTVKMYKGITDSATLIEPVYTEGTTYYYQVEAGGKYYYTAKPTTGYSRYHLRQNLYITAEEAATKTVIDVTPPLRSTNGWDPSQQISRQTDEMMAHSPSSPELWPSYSEVFTTPAYAEGRNPHRQTTQTEMMTYIEGLDDADDDMYVYILGKSSGPTEAQRFELPLVIFTKADLSGADTLEEAAALIKADSEKNGKVTVHYQAQIHSLEPAAGEAALAMLKRLDGDYGESVLDKLNIYVIPRMNPWGAYKSYRGTYQEGSTATIDINRDFMRLETAEAQHRMRAFNLFDPELVIDGHEYHVHPDFSAVNSRDAMLLTSFIDWMEPEFKEMAIDISYSAFAKLKENGLTYCFYDGSVSGGDGGNVGSCNTAQRGVFHVLIETEGIDGGLHNYERRMMSQISAVEGVLGYAVENTAELKKTVKAQQEVLVNNGLTYDDSDYYIMKSSATKHPEYDTVTKKVTVAGEVSDVTIAATIRDHVERSRTLPTAYVIPAGESWNQTVLDLMDKHGISYTFIEAGSSLMLQQYTGTVTEATLTEESAVTFPNGAYVFTMNQVDGYILAGLMEPDVDMQASDKGTLVQQEIITATDGTFPIYRYIRNLNADGFVDFVGQKPAAPVGLTVVNAKEIGQTGKITGLDINKIYEYRAEGDSSYTTVTAGATEITGLPVGKYYVRFVENGDTLASLDAVLTLGYEPLGQCVVYLDGVNGDDTNDALTEASPVKTFEKAYEQLDFLMQYAAEGVSGKILLTGNVTVNQYNYTLPAHDYPVIITSKTGEEGIVHSTGSSEKRIFTMGGDTTMVNMTLTLTTRYSDNFLCAGGHKLVIENSVKTVANKDGNSFNLIGGRYDAATSGSDMTIKGGTWLTVYVNSYSTGLTGNAKVVLSDCSVSRVTPSYSGTTTGDVYISLENVTVRTELYCGNTSKGNVTGNVTLVLGEGVTSPKIYAGSRTAGNVGGTVTVILNGIDLTTNTIHGKANNATGTIGGLKLVLNQGQLANVADSFITRDGVDVVLGCDQTEAVTIPYSVNLDLKGCDAANVTIADGKTATVKDSATDDYTVEDAQGYGILSATGTCVPAEGYVVVEEENGFSYHKKELALTNIAIRSSAAGIYYVGQFGMDEVLREDVIAYGVILSVNPNPTLGGEGCQYTRFTSWGNTTTGNGTLLTGIMKPTNTYSLNKRNSETVVYGRAYLETKDGIVYSEETGFSLRQAVEKADAVWEDLTQSQKDGLIAMYQTYTNVMRFWDIPNIKAAA